MRRSLYIPTEVKENISNHISIAIKQAVEGFLSANEDEDTMTGHLGALLRLRDQRVSVSQQKEGSSGVWIWSIDYFKFRGRGPGATENVLGADGLIELRLNRGGSVDTKSLLFQSKLNWGSDQSLLFQCIKLSTWREAAFVLNYRPSGFQAFRIDEVIRSRGNYSGRLTHFSLEEFIGRLFVDCQVGDNDLIYNPKSRRLVWKTSNNEKVSMRFTIPQRLRINIEAPDNDPVREISVDEVYAYRINSSPEDILSLEEGYTDRDLTRSRGKFALTYHPDKYTEFNEMYRKIVERRMQEANNAYDIIANRATRI
jgi:hypothetical protein